MQKSTLREVTRPPLQPFRLVPGHPLKVTNPTGFRYLFLMLLFCRNKQIYAYFLIFLLSYIKRYKYPKISFVLVFGCF